MYICLCLGVTTITVQHAIDAGARSTKQVAEACGAGSVCGRCGHTIRTMIEAAAADPPASKPARLRRRWGRTLGTGGTPFNSYVDLFPRDEIIGRARRSISNFPL